MPTTENAVRSALGAVSSDASFLLGCSWANERYQQIVSRVRFKHLRRVGEFVAPAAITGGTANVTNGSVNVTVSVATTNAIVGRHFRAANAWYKIATYVNAFQFTLDSAYSETTNTASGYSIDARFITLASEVRWIAPTIVMGRTRWPFNQTPLESMDMMYPGRIIANSTTLEAWSEVGSALNTGGVSCKQIELYPAMTNAEIFYFVYWKLPVDIKEPTTTIPPEIDQYVLKEGILVDVMRNKMAVAVDAGKLEAAAHWRNEYRAQETKWENYIKDAIKADKGVDDSTFVLQAVSRKFAPDIVTARDEIVARGNWP